jgi:hypothetical protein
VGAGDVAQWHSTCEVRLWVPSPVLGGGGGSGNGQLSSGQANQRERGRTMVKRQHGPKMPELLVFSIENVTGI